MSRRPARTASVRSQKKTQNVFVEDALCADHLKSGSEWTELELNLLGISLVSATKLNFNLVDKQWAPEDIEPGTSLSFLFR